MKTAFNKWSKIWRGVNSCLITVYSLVLFVAHATFWFLMFLQFCMWLYRTCTQAVDIYTATSFPYEQICGGSSAVKARTMPWLGLLFAARHLNVVGSVLGHSVGIYGGHSSSVTGFCPSSPGSSCQCNSINTPYSLIHLSPTLETTALACYGSVPLGWIGWGFYCKWAAFLSTCAEYLIANVHKFTYIQPVYLKCR